MIKYKVIKSFFKISISLFLLTFSAQTLSQTVLPAYFSVPIAVDGVSAFKNINQQIVGPGSKSERLEKVAKELNKKGVTLEEALDYEGLSVKNSTGLSVLIPIFDPNIPQNPDDYEKESIWPELRRAEANRFAVQLRDAIAETRMFDAVRVSPDATATAHLYVFGTIIDSNGEDIRLKLSVIDIAGKKLLGKTIKHRVKDYTLNDPRLENQDLYNPIFIKAAGEITKLQKKLKSEYISELKKIEEIRFAEAFSPVEFSKHIKTSKKGRIRLLSFPANDDPALKRIRSLRVRDQMFIDNIQIDYDNFRNNMEEDYVFWQRQAFTESKAAREAKSKARGKMFIGILTAAAGAALLGDGSDYSGAAVTLAGAAIISDAVEENATAAAHKASLGELGRSLNIELAPRVMDLEDKTVELSGTAMEQYSTWRKYLKEIYDLEMTPNKII